MAEQRSDKGMSQPDRVKFLLNQMSFPSTDSPVFNSNRFLDTGINDSRTETDLKSHFSFRGFSKRVSTYLPQYWGADPNAALYFAKHGWIGTTGFSIHCSNCLATMDCQCFIQKPDVWILIARKGHGKLCRWACIPSPDNFIKIPEDPKLTYENMLEVWRKLYTLGNDLPSLSRESVAEMGIDNNTVELFFKLLQVPISEEGMSALVLGICGWAKSTSEKSLHCNFCDRHIGLWNFCSIEDKKPQTKEPQTSSRRTLKRSERHAVVMHSNNSEDDTVLEDKDTAMREKSFDSLESLDSENDISCQTKNSSGSREIATECPVLAAGQSGIACQESDDIAFSRTNLSLQSNVFVKKKLLFLGTFRNQVHKRVIKQNILKRKTANLFLAQGNFKPKQTLGNASLFNKFAVQHAELYDSYDSESDSSLDSQELQIYSKSNVQRIGKSIDRREANNILVHHKGMSVNASQFEEFVNNKMLDCYDSESDSSVDNEELQVYSEYENIQRSKRTSEKEETDYVSLPQEGIDLVSEGSDNSNHSAAYNTGNLVNPNPEFKNDRLEVRMDTKDDAECLLNSTSKVDANSGETEKQLVCEGSTEVSDSNKDSDSEESKINMIPKNGNQSDSFDLPKENINDSDSKEMEKDEISNKEGTATLNFKDPVTDTCTRETVFEKESNMTILCGTEATNDIFLQEEALDGSADKTVQHAVNEQEAAECNNTSIMQGIENSDNDSSKQMAIKTDTDRDNEQSEPDVDGSSIINKVTDRDRDNEQSEPDVDGSSIINKVTDRDNEQSEPDVDGSSNINKVTETSLRQESFFKTPSHESLQIQITDQNRTEKTGTASILCDGIRQDLVNENKLLVNAKERNNVDQSCTTLGDCVLISRTQPVLNKPISVKDSVHGIAMENIKSCVSDTSVSDNVIHNEFDKVIIKSNCPEITKNGITSDSVAVEEPIITDESTLMHSKLASENVTLKHISNDDSKLVLANDDSETIKPCKAVIVLDETKITVNINNLHKDDTSCDISKSMISEVRNESNNSVLKMIENGSGDFAICESSDESNLLKISYDLTESTGISTVNRLGTSEKCEPMHTDISSSENVTCQDMTTGDKMQLVGDDDMDTSSETTAPKMLNRKSVTEVATGEVVVNSSNSNKDSTLTVCKENIEKLDCATTTIVMPKDDTVIETSVANRDNVLLGDRSNNSIQNSASIDYLSKSVSKMKDVDLLVESSLDGQTVNNVTEERPDGSSLDGQTVNNVTEERPNGSFLVGQTVNKVTEERPDGSSLDGQTVNNVTEERPDGSSLDGQTVNKVTEERPHGSSLDGQTVNKVTEERPHESSLDGQTVNKVTEERPDRSSLDGQTVNNVTEERPDGSSLDGQTVNNVTEERPDGSSLDGQTVNNVTEERPDGSSLDGQTINNVTEERPDRSSLDGQTVNNVTEKRPDSVKTNHIETSKSGDNFTMDCEEKNVKLNQPDNTFDSSESNTLNRPDSSCIDATKETVKIISGKPASEAVGQIVGKVISAEIQLVNKGGIKTDLEYKQSESTVVLHTTDNTTTEEMEMVNECSKSNHSSEEAERVTMEVSVANATAGKMRVLDEKEKTDDLKGVSEQSTNNSTSEELEKADENFTSKPSLTGVMCENSTRDNKEVGNEVEGSAVSVQRRNNTTVNEMDVTNEHTERNTNNEVSSSMVVEESVDVNENVESNQLNETSESAVTGQANATEEEMSVDMDPSNDSHVADGKLINACNSEVNKSDCFESVDIVEETVESKSEMCVSDQSVELVESSVVLDETVHSDSLKRDNVEHLRMSDNNESSTFVNNEGRTVVNKSEGEEYVVDVPSDSDIEIPCARSQCPVLECEVDMDDAIEQTIIISNSRSCATFECEEVKDESPGNITLTVINSGEYSSLNNNPIDIEESAPCSGITNGDVTNNATDKTSRKRKFDCSEDIKESPDFKRIKWDYCNVKVDFHPVNEHRFWCIWRLDAMDELCRPNTNIAKKGWQQVLDHLKLGISIFQSAHKLPEYFEELMKLGDHMDNW